MTAIRLGGIPLPGSRDALFDGADTDAALAGAEATAALTGAEATAARVGDEQEDGKTGRFTDGADACTDGAVGPRPTKLPAFPPSREFSLFVC
jgi:hypothetical protein